MIASIELRFSSSKDAEYVCKAIDPDNSPVPQGIKIHTSTKNETLHIKIECNRGIDSFRTTVEDMMGAIDLSVRTLESIE